MDLAQSWTASSQDLSAGEREDLEAIAGNWSTQVQVIVTRPTVFVRGPIETQPERQTVRVVRDDNQA